MAQDLREIVESPQYQGEDEEIVYALTTTNFGSAPTDPAVVVKDVTDGGNTDVTATVTTGAASVFGDIITLPKILDLTAGNFYRVEVMFTSGSNLFESFFYIRARE